MRMIYMFRAFFDECNERPEDAAFVSVWVAGFSRRVGRVCGRMGYCAEGTPED